MTAPAVNDAPNCPKCGGRMWDNRMEKRNHKAPDFKCRDRACGGCIWPPKGPRTVATTPAVASAPRAVGHIPGDPLDPYTNPSPTPSHFPATTATPPSSPDRFTALAALHTRCFEYACTTYGPTLEAMETEMGPTLAALTAQLFIAVTKEPR